MTLENLVPPLELCKQIPAGAFTDSALVWYNDGFFWKIAERYTTQEVEVPAPTLAEILAAIADYEDTLSVHIDLIQDNFWQVEWAYCNLYCDYSRESKTEIEKSAATAALKLWLDLEGGK